MTPKCQMLNQIEKIVVIAGCQRSGTTLVGQVLGAHPKAILIDETDGLYDWFADALGLVDRVLENSPLERRAIFLRARVLANLRRENEAIEY